MNIPNALEERLRAQLAGEYPAFAECLGGPGRESYRVNTLKADADENFPFQGERIPWCRAGYYSTAQVGDTVEHFQGLVYVQEAASMLAAEILGAEPGETVLDMSAAPGSKTTQLAALMENTGCIVANEIDPKRANALRFNLNRMGVVNAAVTVMDARGIGMEGGFDRILLDAPCSNTGQLRDNPKALETWSMRKVAECAKLQKRLIGRAAELLKAGGVLVYSTCTDSPEENEEVVDHAVEEHNMRVDGVKADIRCHEGIAEWMGRRYSEDVRKTVRIYPHDNDTAGFYAARLVKG